MFRALVESVNRFDNLPPIGYEERDIKWVIDIDPNTGCANLPEPYRKRELVKSIPTRGERSGQVTAKNLKPALLVDKATYALGIPEPGKEKTTELKHQGFVELLKEAYSQTRDPEIDLILQFLQNGLPDNIYRKIKHNDLVAFRTNPLQYPFEKEQIKQFWAHFLEGEYREGEAHCAICGSHGPSMRILPWQISFRGYSCPLSAFNASAFESFGKKQTKNVPLCFSCASKASQVLQYLVRSGRHSHTLAKDDAKGEGKSPLRNQLAVFWLKEAHIEIPDESITIDLEELLKVPLDANSIATDAGPPPALDQLKSLLNVPWKSREQAMSISDNRFYMAVLSPNKSRLVIREWIDESLESVRGNLKDFIEALSIIHPDGVRAWSPPVPPLLGALKPEQSGSATTDANLIRGLLRTAYLGHAPPQGLLETAVQRFRIPDKPTRNNEEREKQDLRRMCLTTVMKLVFAYRKKEAKSMEQLDDKRRTQPYLCGRLLAVLEEIQSRHSKWKLNTTLVDRFYGAASTAPASVFGNLIKRATTDHLPKLRREGHRRIGETLEDVVGALDDVCGFPDTLKSREQAEFALGFYHQRAEFRKQRSQGKGRITSAEQEAKKVGGTS